MKRVLVYKRTHRGDPDKNGCFGIHDCMGAVRDWDYDAVIGVGGMSAQAQSWGIAGQINWIGIGPHKTPVPSKRGPEVTFDHFRYFGTQGPDFRTLAPTLAERMYSKNIRVVMYDVNEQEYHEEIRILGLADDAPPSPGGVDEPELSSRLCRCAAKHPTRRCT